MTDYAIDHIGYLTGDIAATAREFGRLGYKAGCITADDTQRTRICFLAKPGEVRIELVEPYENNKTMQKMLARQGVAPYHTCYQVDDVEKEYETLVAHNWTPLFKPVAAPAFGGRKICYFWNAEIGYIELVNINL